MAALILAVIKTICLFPTRKGFSEKPIVAFTNSTVFILDFYIYMTKSIWSHVLALSALPTITDCMVSFAITLNHSCFILTH